MSSRCVCAAVFAAAKLVLAQEAFGTAGAIVMPSASEEEDSDPDGTRTPRLLRGQAVHRLDCRPTLLWLPQLIREAGQANPEKPTSASAPKRRRRRASRRVRAWPVGPPFLSIHPTHQINLEIAFGAQSLEHGVLGLQRLPPLDVCGSRPLKCFRHEYTVCSLT